MDQIFFSSVRLAAFCAAILAAEPAAASDFLKQLARQAAGDAVQALARGASAQSAPALASLSAAAAAAGTAGTPYVRAGAQPPRMRLEDGTVFYGDYIADYWSRPDASDRGSTPSLDAPGRILAGPLKFGASRKQPEYAALQRKLETVVARVMQHPALARVRGASLVWGAYFGHDDGRQPLVAKLSVIAYPIKLDDPDTRRFPDGGYHTPGEGPVLRITVNDPEEIGTRQPSGGYRGMTVLREGYMFVVPNTDRPLFVEADGMKAVNPDLLDRTRARSDIQFMTVYVGAAGPTMSNLTHKRVDPVGNTGRLIGVLYNTDWHGILREANTAG